MPLRQCPVCGSKKRRKEGEHIFRDSCNIKKLKKMSYPEINNAIVLLIDKRDELSEKLKQMEVDLETIVATLNSNVWYLSQQQNEIKKLKSIINKDSSKQEDEF